ncbi:conjugal transfer protein TraD, partial [Klebsiella pneumoniae]
SAQIREILISESAWEEMTCLFAPSLGAEVAKALDCDVFTVDKELVLGMLLETPNLHPDDKVRFRKNGLLFLASMKGRKT